MKKMIKRTLSLFLTFVLAFSCLSIVLAPISNARDAHTLTQIGHSVIHSGSNNRYDNGDMNIVNDGQNDNTDAGLIRFDIGGLNANRVKDVKLSVIENDKSNNSNTALAVNFYYTTSTKAAEFIPANNGGGHYTRSWGAGNSAIDTYLNNLGVDKTSGFLGSNPQSNKQVRVDIDITEQFKAAINTGSQYFYVVLMMNMADGEGDGGGGWSDSHYIASQQYITYFDHDEDYVIPAGLNNSVASAAPETFNGQAYYGDSGSNINVATGAYSNIVYSSRITKFSDDAGAFYTLTKVAMPYVTVMAYDGVHSAYMPVVFEAAPQNGTDGTVELWYCSSRFGNAPMQLDGYWNGVKHEGQWYEWPASRITFSQNMSNVESDAESNKTIKDFYNSNSKYNNSYHCFFWNKIVYNGSGNTSDYYEKITDIKNYRARGSYKSWGTWHNENGNMTVKDNPACYVINYKPIYDILTDTETCYNNAMGHFYGFTELFNEVWGNEEHYEVDSLNDYYKAVKEIVDINIHSTFSDVNDSNAESKTMAVASAIKTAYEDYVAAVRDLSAPEHKYNNNDYTACNTNRGYECIKCRVCQFAPHQNERVKNYTVSFDGNGGSVVSNKSYNIELNEDLPVETRNYYDLMGYKVTSLAAEGNWTVNSVVGAGTSLRGKYGNVNLQAQWRPADSATVDDSTILSFSLPTEVNVADNDNLGGTIVAFGTSDKQPSDTLDSSYTSGTLNTSYGTFTVSNGKVRFVPNGTLTSDESVYVAIQIDGSYVYSKLELIPSSTIYFEDDAPGAITYTNGVSADGKTGTWTVAGASLLGSKLQDEYNSLFGYSDVYAASDNAGYSMGSAHKVSVSIKNNPNSKYSGASGTKWPEARFSFSGTGFDIISLMSMTTGVVEVKVENSQGTIVKDTVVDTFHNYKLRDEAEANGNKWEVSEENYSTMYQVPVISVKDLAYGTYTVTLIPQFNSKMNHTGNDSYEFYLDAVKIYEPLGQSALVDAYADYSEQNTQLFNVRSLLLSKSTLEDSIYQDTGTDGVIFINDFVNSGGMSVADYAKAGPKNEIYLAKNQAIAFDVKLTDTNGVNPIYIGARAVDGNPVSVRFANANLGYVSGPTSISSATSLYYRVSTYYTSGDNCTIIIMNQGDGVLAIRDIKIKYSTPVAYASPAMMTMSRVSADKAVELAETIATMDTDAPGIFEPSELKTADINKVTAGESAKLTFTTSSEVFGLLVDGHQAELISENDDGTKTWSYAVTPEIKRGTQKVNVVAYDMFGGESDPVEVEITVETKFETFINDFFGFIAVIIDLFKELFNMG